MANESANDICSVCGVRRGIHLVLSEDHLFTTRVGKRPAISDSGPNLPDMLTYDEIAIWHRIQEQIPKNRLMKLGGHVVPRDYPFADMSRLVVLESLGPDNPLYYRARIELRDLYVVWSVKVLRNWKTLVSTDKIAGIYFEVTYNGDTGEAYVDEYRKSRNTVVKIADGKPASV